MTQAAAFRATYADWKLIKTRSVVQVVFEVPLEQADLAYQVIGGMPDPGAERWCAIARLNAGVTVAPDLPVEAAGPVTSSPCGEQDRPVTPRKPVAADKRLAQQAGICCSDPVFQQFLLEQRHIIDKSELDAAAFVRHFCGVNSRTWITPSSEAGAKWHELYGRFSAWKAAMIRIAIGKTALEDDSSDAAAAAYGAGWRIDEDDWWVRPAKDADPMSIEHEGFGFVDQRHVFVASAEAAVDFDRHGHTEIAGQ